MRAVFTFSRTPVETIARLKRVFEAGGPAREQLSQHAEVLVEPVGWDALWKLSKDFCKKFDVRYPCVAYVTVTSVFFEELSACVEVQSVQHESVSLPECVQDVPLVELWPTIKQQEKCIDAATTAEFIDLMRFFYKCLWMPWDDQDDGVLLPKTIEERMQLWTDINNGTIPSSVARKIILLRNSAIDAQERLKALDLSDYHDNEDNDEDEDYSLLPSNYIAFCMELTAKLECLEAKWPLYEKAFIRQQYLAKEQTKWQKNKSRRNVVALWEGGSASELSQISEHLQRNYSNEYTVTMTPSAEQAFSLEPEELVVCSPQCEVPEMPVHNIIISSFNGGALKSCDMRSCLLQLSADCALSGLTLWCTKVNTVVVARAGTLYIRNCTILDDSSNRPKVSDFAQGIVVMAGAKVVIEDTVVENFYSGIVVHKLAHVELKNCTVRNCGVGIQMYEGWSHVELNNSTISHCAEHCIRVERHIITDNSTLQGLKIHPNSKIGSGDLQKEVLMVSQDAAELDE